MTDVELMRAVCNGDKNAYQTIVKQHLSAISHYAFRMLGNKKDTEDICQETFLKLWINASKWDASKASLSTWLHRIAHNLSIDYLRKHSRVQTQDMNEEQVLLQATGTEVKVVENTEPAPEFRLARLKRAIGELPESQRSALTLCHFQAFSNKEAAAIMGISVVAMESLLARARRSLIKIVKEDAD